MEYIETILNILGYVSGGGLLVFATWRFAKRKAAAEAKQAEAVAKQAEAEAEKARAQAMLEKQNYYQQMADDISKDRDYYKQERDEMRRTIKSYDERIDELERKVARNGRIVESLRPFICTDLKCKLRHRAVISENGEIEKEGKKRTEKKDIEPLELKDM